MPATAGRRWTVAVRFRGQFAYLDGHLPDGEVMPLCRLRYGGSASSWGFAIYLASRDGYQDSILPNGHTAGSPEEALDCACGLYLNDPTAWRRSNTGELTGRTTSRSVATSPGTHVPPRGQISAAVDTGERRCPLCVHALAVSGRVTQHRRGRPRLIRRPGSSSLHPPPVEPSRPSRSVR